MAIIKEGLILVHNIGCFDGDNQGMIEESGAFNIVKSQQKMHLEIETYFVFFIQWNAYKDCVKDVCQCRKIMHAEGCIDLDRYILVAVGF